MDTPRMSTTPPASNPWASLLPPAMVGTDKKPFTLQPWDGAVGALLAQVQAQAGSNPAQTLLQAAGVLAVCERARPATLHRRVPGRVERQPDALHMDRQRGTHP